MLFLFILFGIFVFNHKFCYVVLQCMLVQIITLPLVSKIITASGNNNTLHMQNVLGKEASRLNHYIRSIVLLFS